MEFRLLGPLEVVEHDRPVALPQGRARSLLALLALRPGEVVPVDRLIDELWSGDPPVTAGTALQGLVSALRKRLEPGRSSEEPPTVLVTHTPGYVLAVDHDQVDVHRFQRLVMDAIPAPAPERASRLRAALALWRGPALADFSYEPFAQAPISTLEELRVTALEARLDADLALGRHAEVVTELEDLVNGHPLREGLLGQLMVALYRCGRQAHALDVYRAARRRLVEELGVEPSPRLQSVERAVLTHDPSLRAPEPVSGPGPGDEDRAEAGGRAWLAAGRRTVTVVFVDLSMVEPPTAVDSGDPEAAHPIVGRAQATAREVLEQFGGTVEGIIGDVAVSVFGLPVAHEDDAARAVQATCELRKHLERLNAEAERDHGVRLAARAGIDTGEVVVGDPTGRATSGPPVRHAARLQQVAADGEVLLGHTTWRLVQEIAVVEPAAGDAEPPTGAPAWRLVDVVAATSGSVATESPHVGRAAELAELHAAFDWAARERRAALVTVVAEAGVGKSRLARAFCGSLAGQARVVTGHCRAYGEGITFWPLREIVLELADGAGREGLVRLLGSVPHGRSDAAQIAAATGISDEPMNRPDHLFSAVRRVLEASACDASLITVLEDIHWAQPTFLDLVEYLAETVRAPVLLLCLARPELVETRPRWAAEVTSSRSLELQPLTMAESRKLVTDRLGGRLLAPESMGEVLAMGQGNPLFLEQLLAALRDDAAVDIPPTLQALLTARLDRLGPAERDLVRSASAIGVDVSIDALRAIVPEQVRPHLARHLQALEAKDLIGPFVAAGTDSPRFEFRHALIQQAAYRSLTHAARAELHERVARWFETEAAMAPVEVEELVGLHLEQAVRHRRDLGRTDHTTDQLAVRAGERLAGAGLRAYARFDVPAAENLLSRARALLPAEHAQRPAVLRRLTEAYPIMGRPQEAAACFEELLDLVGRDGVDPLQQEIRLEQIRFRLITGPDPIPMATIRRDVEESLATFRHTGDEVRLSQAHYVLASVHLRAGRMSELESTARRGMDHARQSGELREQLGAPWWVVLHLLAGPTPVPVCIRTCEEIMDVAGMKHLGVMAALGHFRAMRGENHEGRAMVERARDLLRERIRVPRPLAFIGQQRADVELLAGNAEAAVQALRQALDIALRVTERHDAAVIAARLALLLSRQGDTVEAARLAALASDQAPAESVTAQALTGVAQARVSMDAGDAVAAERLGREAIRPIPTDMLDLQAQLHSVLAEIVATTGREHEARCIAEEAGALYRRKGNLVAAARVHDIPATL